MNTHFLKPLATAAALALSGGAAHADTGLSGTWRTATYNGDYAFVRFGPCSGKICGVVTRTFGPDGEIDLGELEEYVRAETSIGKKFDDELLREVFNLDETGHVWQPEED